MYAHLLLYECRPGLPLPNGYCCLQEGNCAQAQVVHDAVDDLAVQLASVTHTFLAAEQGLELAEQDQRLLQAELGKASASVAGSGCVPMSPRERSHR